MHGRGHLGFFVLRVFGIRPSFHAGTPSLSNLKSVASTDQKLWVNNKTAAMLGFEFLCFLTFGPFPTVDINVQL
jgi:hypothetical protein